jgi:hypothetical protein
MAQRRDEELLDPPRGENPSLRVPARLDVHGQPPLGCVGNGDVFEWQIVTLKRSELLRCGVVVGAEKAHHSAAGDQLLEPVARSSLAADHVSWKSRHLLPLSGLDPPLNVSPLES